MKTVDLSSYTYTVEKRIYINSALFFYVENTMCFKCTTRICHVKTSFSGKRLEWALAIENDKTSSLDLKKAKHLIIK